MQHIEPAGIHSGDSYAVLPPFNLGDFVMTQIEDITEENCSCIENGWIDEYSIRYQGRYRLCN